MNSKREEERNEKIIRGLMKLPPNRRCINCNSLGPGYVCTNFWTFICITCSGIHREFTHRVKSVSMAKFTSQEVDALQKGGNQRAKELFLKSWDLQRNRLPDNSNVEKVREFIKNVYVDKKYTVEKSSDRPPRDPQSARSQDDEIRRASSYHSYSQSPPYDFQYEERRTGKRPPTLTRRPGSDHGLYDGKLASFLSPTHLSDDGFASEGSGHRASDYSVSGGGDPFRSDALSPSSQRDIGETSREISPEIRTAPDANVRSDGGGRLSHQQRAASLGSLASHDSSSMSFKSVNSLGLPEPAQPAEGSLEKSLSLPSSQQSSLSATFSGLDLFSAPFAPQNVTSAPTNGITPISQSVNVLPQSSVSAVPAFTEQRPPQVPQPRMFDLFAAFSEQQVEFPQASQIPQSAPLNPSFASSQQQLVESSNGKASDVAVPQNGGWATFDNPQNVLPTNTEKSLPTLLPSSDGNIFEHFNPFETHQSSLQDSAGHEPSQSTHAFWHENLQNTQGTIHSTESWNAFGNSYGGQTSSNEFRSNVQVVQSAGNSNVSLGFGGFEVLNNGSARTLDVNAPPPSSNVPSHLSMSPNDFPMVSEVAGIHAFGTDQKSTNPFDMLFDSDVESSNTSQLWDMSSLQGALPNTQMPSSTVGEVNEFWFSQNSVPSYVPNEVPFDPTSGSLGYMAGEAPHTQIQNIHAQGSVASASVGGNPFA